MSEETTDDSENVTETQAVSVCRYEWPGQACCERGYKCISPDCKIQVLL